MTATLTPRKAACTCHADAKPAESKLEPRDIAEFGEFWAQRVQGDPKRRVKMRMHLRLQKSAIASDANREIHDICASLETLRGRLLDFIEAHNDECTCDFCQHLSTRGTEFDDDREKQYLVEDLKGLAWAMGVAMSPVNSMLSPPSMLAASKVPAVA